MTDWWLTAQQAVTKHGALQDPHELAVLLALLASREPETVVEIGTWAGGMAWAFSQLPSVAHIIAVDHARMIGGTPVTWENPGLFELIRADSGDPHTQRMVLARLPCGTADVVFIDGDHTYVGARKDWALYCPLVRDGGLVVIHDTQGYPGRLDVEVPKLWAEIRKDYTTTELVSRPGGPYGTGIVWL